MEQKSETTIRELTNENLNLKQAVSNLEQRLLLSEHELEDMKMKWNYERLSVKKLEEQLVKVDEKFHISKMLETNLIREIHFLRVHIDSLKQDKVDLNQRLDGSVSELEHEVELLSSEFRALRGRTQKHTDYYVEIEEKLRKSEEKVAEYGRMVMNLKQTEDRCKELESRLKMDAKEAAAKQKSLVEQLNESEKRRKELEEILKKFNQERHRKGMLDVNKQMTMLNLSETVREQQRKAKEEYERIISELKVENSELKKLEGMRQELIAAKNEIQRLTIITENSQTLQMKLEANIKRVSELESQVSQLTDQNGFLREKCERFAQNVLEEQSKTRKALAERSSVCEREKFLGKELERLRIHLAEIKDMYTQALLEAEQRNKNVGGTEEREKNPNTPVEPLVDREKLSDCEDDLGLD